MQNNTEISTFFLVLRRVRGPLIALILIYALAVLGLTLVPGPPDAQGHVQKLSFFHAFYFVSYTATTIGFGEIPYAFSEQQRLWVLVCIYLSVVGWAIFIGKLLQLSQDVNLQRAIRTNRFGHDVRKLQEPFFIVCGYGETGHRICAALDHMGYRVVVLELDGERLSDIELQSYVADMPHLQTDAANPNVLQRAGLRHPHCQGLIVMTNHDASNLAIAITGRLLAPRLPILARAEQADTAANMASFHTPHIINPFQKFSDFLALALHAPAAYRLHSLLTGQITSAETHRPPPRGHWLLLGFGRMARQLAERIAQEGLPVTVIDLHPEPHDLQPGVQWIQGDGTCAPALLQAGIENAVGLICATANDINNLSTAVTARHLNRHIFVIARQNNVVHQTLFDYLQADMTMVPSAVLAHECLAILTTPLLAPFLHELQQAPQAWCTGLLQQLRATLGDNTPHEVWSVRISPAHTPALYTTLRHGTMVNLGAVLKHPGQRQQALPCVVLQRVRHGHPTLLLPDLASDLQTGDELLLVGSAQSKRQLALTLGYQHTLQYVLTGQDLPAGWLWQHWAKVRQRERA